MPNEVLEQLGGVSTEETPATDGLGSEAAPSLEEIPEPAAEEPQVEEATSEAATPTEPETDAPETSEETPAWAQYKTVDEVLNHESFAVAKKELEDKGYERGRGETRRLQGYLHTQQNTLKAIDEKAQSFVDGWNRLVEAGRNGNLDTETLRDLKKEHGDMFESLTGFRQDASRWDGIGSVVAGIAEATQSEELGKEFGERIGQVRTGVLDKDETFFDDLATEIAKAKMKPLENELVEAKAKIGRLEEEIKTLSRQEKAPPPETPSGSADNKGGESAVLSSSSAGQKEKSDAFERKYGFKPPGIPTGTLTRN